MSTRWLRRPLAAGLVAALPWFVTPVTAAAHGHPSGPRAGGGQPSRGEARVAPRGGGSVSGSRPVSRPGTGRFGGGTRVNRVFVNVFDPDDFWFWGPRFSFAFGWGWPYRGWYGPLYPLPYGYVRTVPGNWTGIELRVHPRKATVRVDGETVGQARDFNSDYNPLWLQPGRHVLELGYPDYMTLRVAFKARVGGYYTLRYDLVEGHGVDPRSDKVAPLPAEGPEPSGGGQPGGGPGDGGGPGGSVNGGGNAGATWYDDGPDHGRLQIQAGPPDAVVYLGGQFLGRADELARLHGPIPVKQGKHRVEVVRPGYASRTVVVDVQGTEATMVRVDLQPGPQG